MDNNKDFAKVMEGLTGAKNILNTMLTPDILAKMTPEQIQELGKAKKGINEKGINKAMQDLQNFIKKFK